MYACFVVENHDVPIVGYVGVHRIVDLIKWAYWLRGLWGYIVVYVRSCLACQQMKMDNRKKASVL